MYVWTLKVCMYKCMCESDRMCVACVNVHTSLYEWLYEILCGCICERWYMCMCVCVRECVCIWICMILYDCWECTNERMNRLFAKIPWCQSVFRSPFLPKATSTVITDLEVAEFAKPRKDQLFATPRTASFMTFADPSSRASNHEPGNCTDHRVANCCP